MKVAVYTIALNEAANAERWARSCAEADYRVVADTGSTDGTVERLEAEGVTVHRIAIRPWRFDLARNAALALLPGDVDLCCTMDMDRYLEPGWREALEATWTPETTSLFTRVAYRAEPFSSEVLRSFPVKTFHLRAGYRWVRPVHEETSYLGKEIITDCPGIVMSEVQDVHKPTRRQYLPLMELAHREDPTDSQICFWLGREYMYEGQSAQAASLLAKYLDLPLSKWSEERSQAMRFLSRVEPERRRYWLDRARLEAPHRREVWLDLAELLYEHGEWASLFWACSSGIEQTRKTNSYLDEAHCWGSRLYDLGALAASHLKVHELAVNWGSKALELEPNNSRLRSNLEFYKAPLSANYGRV